MSVLITCDARQWQSRDDQDDYFEDLSLPRFVSLPNGYSDYVFLNIIISRRSIFQPVAEESHFIITPKGPIGTVYSTNIYIHLPYR